MSELKKAIAFAWTAADGYGGCGMKKAGGGKKERRGGEGRKERRREARRVDGIRSQCQQTGFLLKAELLERHVVSTVEDSPDWL
jgi:hypothetical protein